ncbi:Uma2 family endonuclease [Pedobacter metabolipauper]|uniref:Uma2 family endonuclease n=1 Tax=Pedobacter metabolipauper TaxID=425513 RepID=A0A4R6T0Q7_9SPHI|nr:Uma2 family endonuclease [Pedobacter metabolipauper]TDQ11168.1 Uma2 family endonuclease [Pedobacter metabolipauper]
MKKRTPKPCKINGPVIQTLNELDMSATYSYAHYLRWRFEERVELIRGKVFKMAEPATLHQQISWEIGGAFYNYLKGKIGKAYAAPFDVRFPKGSHANKDIFTVVQPDLCIICDVHKIDHKGCIGAPDVVVEILSPGNNNKELAIKYGLYEEFKVKEYWIADPRDQSILKYTLNENGHFTGGEYYIRNDKLRSDLLPGFCLPVSDVFALKN